MCLSEREREGESVCIKFTKAEYTHITLSIELIQNF